ncbi:MAG: metallophosphoesterase, partial [Candidatus Riflemargulisbacteria bacterium]
MKILQFSYIHIDSTTDIEAVKLKLTKMKEAILCRLVPGEELLICVCCDIIDQGDSTLFETACKIFDYIKSDLLSTITVKFEFVPGNHDLCKNEFVDFDNFTKRYTGVQYEYNDKVNSHLRIFNGLDFLLSNSTFHKDSKIGMLDIQGLRKLTIQNPTILVVHHTLLSENDDDTSAIRNAYKLMEWVESNNIIAILHGHTHGYKNIVIGETCRVIGVGPFLKQIPDINNQFNFIETSEGRIDKVFNYRYSADLDEFSCHNVFTGERCNTLTSSSVKDLYDTIVRETKHYKSIYNLKANLTCEFSSFEKEIQTHFSDIIPIAKDWQSQDVPENLYYNHGKYMQSESIWGMDYIIRELKNKSTSSRAI